MAKWTSSSTLKITKLTSSFLHLSLRSKRKSLFRIKL